MPTVRVRLDAQVTDYLAGMRRAQQETKDLAARLKITEREARQAQRGLAQHAEKSRASMQKVGDTALRAGVVGAAGLAAVGKAAMDWESAFAGVTKTLDVSNAAFGTAAQQTDAVEKGLRNLARTMPTSHEELAGIAEAAGQLGIATPNVVDFTKVVAELADTTNLTADEAATSLAQFMTITNSAADSVDNLGSTIVYLGNNGASTETQILDMGQRIAGAGTQIGISADKILGISSAIASTGMNVEAGGTAMSKVMGKLQTAVDMGGDHLDAFSKTAGMSTEAFSKLFKEDAAGAIDAFVEGLGRVQKSGGNVRQALGDAGIKGQYEVDTLSRLAGASKAAGRETGLLTENIKNGTKGFEDNTALAKEAATRYETTASKIAIAWNKIKDSAITAGGVILPLVADLAGSIGKAADAFGAMSPQAQKSAVYLLAIGTAGLLAVTGTVKIAGAVKGASDVFKTLSGSSSAATRALGKFGGAAGGIGIAFAAGAGAIGLMEQKFNVVTPSLQELNNQILDMAKNPGVDVNKLFQFEEMDDFMNLVHGGMDGLNSTLTRLGENNFGDKVTAEMDSILGTTRSSTTQARAQLAQLDKSFVSLSETGAGDAVATEFKRMVDEIKRGGGDVQGRLSLLTNSLPGYRDMVLAAAHANGNLKVSDDELLTLMSGGLPAGFKTAADAAAGTAAGNTKVSDTAKDATTDIKALTQALNDQASAALAASGSARGVQSAINTASRAAKEYVDAMKSKAEQEARDRGESDKAVTAAGKRAAANARASIETGKAFHGTSDESLALQEALDGVAAASLTNLDAMVKNGAGADEVEKANKKARRAFLDVADSMGVGSKEAKRMADDYFDLGHVDAKPKITAPDDAALKRAKLTREEFNKLPKKVKSEIVSTYNNKGQKEGDRKLTAAGKKKYHPKIDVVSNAQTKETEARQKLQDLSGVVGQPQIQVSSNAGEAAAAAAREMNIPDTNVFIKIWKTFMGWVSGTNSDSSPGLSGPATGGLVTHAGVLYRSHGGGVWGTGTTTSDEIDAKLSNNEYVERAAAVAKYGVPFMRALNNLWVDPKDLPRFATGGETSAPSMLTTNNFAAAAPARSEVIDARVIAEALAGMSSRRGGGGVHLVINNPQTEPTSATIAAAAGYLAAT